MQPSTTSDDATFASHDEIMASWIEQLDAAMPACEAWWLGLEARLGAQQLDLRWPAGVASHPRILAIYAAHFLACMRLNAGAEPPVPAPLRFDDEAAWGLEREGPRAPAPEQIHPVELLIVGLEHESPALFEPVSRLVMNPVGFDATVGAAQRGADAPFGGPTLHRVRDGLRRLLMAPGDVRPLDAMIHGDPPSIDAAHRRLFDAYRGHLGEVLAGADAWWAGIVAKRERAGLGPEQALAAAYEQVPAGPVADPFVLGVVRAYWLACAAINAELPHASRVAPERMLLAWLQDGRHDSWIRVLTAMPYWPLGLDEQGRWV